MNMDNENISVFDVFTPTQQAEKNFVERDALTSTLVDALRTPGKQLVVYGPSGSGKSTLLLNKLHQLYEDHITTPCDSSTTFDQLLLRAFDKLDRFYASSKREKWCTNQLSSLETSYIGIKAKRDSSCGSESEQSLSRLVSTQLTSDRLAEFLSEQELCWVIDDFHKIAGAEKTRLAQCMKIFYDSSYSYKKVKIIVIGAVGTAREVVEYDPDMRTRVCELGVPLMSNDELRLILANGAALMNIIMPTDIENEIIRVSAGLASVCHQLALNMCLERNIERPPATKVVLKHEDFNRAVRRYAEESSDTLKAIFEKALYRSKAVQKFDNCRLILTALANGPVDGMEYGELLAQIRNGIGEYPQPNLSIYLKELQQEKRGEVIRYDTKTARYSFTLPIYQTFALALLSKGLKPKGTWAIQLKVNKDWNVESHAIDKQIFVELVGEMYGDWVGTKNTWRAYKGDCGIDEVNQLNKPDTQGPNSGG